MGLRDARLLFAGSLLAALVAPSEAIQRVHLPSLPAGPVRILSQYGQKPVFRVDWGGMPAVAKLHVWPLEAAIQETAHGILSARRLERVSVPFVLGYGTIPGDAPAPLKALSYTDTGLLLMPQAAGHRLHALDAANAGKDYDPTLAAAVRRKPLPNAALDELYQAFRALAGQGLAHGDVDPLNLIADFEQGRLTLIDFHSAKLNADRRTLELEQRRLEALSEWLRRSGFVR